MSRAIALETSGRIGSIAIVRDGVVLDEEQFPHGLKHAATVLPMIDRLCRKHGWQPRDVEQIYVSAGPGSFTGLRIGVTLAKTLALATGVKIVAVPTMLVLTQNAPVTARHLIIVLDAKRDQVFTARFSRSSDAEPWTTQEDAHLDSLTAMLARSPRPVHLLGEGIPYHRKFIPDEAGVIVTTEESWSARAAAVANVGTQLAQQNQFADPYKLTPIYVRKPEAIEKWELQHGR